ncbi:MAG: DUF6263 family protein [Bacteroidota bacterium]
MQKDSTYYLTTSANLDIDQFIQNKHQLVKTTITGRMSHKVIAVKDTLYTMDVAYQSLKMNMEIGGNAINFDSNGDTTNVFSKLMSRLTGKAFTLVMSKRGQIVTIQNTEKLFQNILDGFPQLDEQKKSQLLAQVKQSFGEKAIKGNFQESFVIFPKIPIAVKNTWTVQTVIDAVAISTKTNTIYTLNKITDKYYDISGAAIVEAGKVPAFKSTNGYLARLNNIAGSTNTTIKIDNKTGWILESKVIKHIKGTMEMKKTTDEPILMSYPMVVNGILTNTGN